MMLYLGTLAEVGSELVPRDTLRTIQFPLENLLEMENTEDGDAHAQRRIPLPPNPPPLLLLACRA